MKDGYFDPRDVKSARRCMRESDEFIVAIGDYRLLSCIELAHAEAYIDKHNLKDDPNICVYQIGDATIDRVDL